MESRDFVSVEKLEQSRKMQVQPAKGSPFFFEDAEKKEAMAEDRSGIKDWITFHKIEAIGFAIVVIGVIAVISLS